MVIYFFVFWQQRAGLMTWVLPGEETVSEHCGGCQQPAVTMALAACPSHPLRHWGCPQGCPHPYGGVWALGTPQGWRRLLWPCSQCVQWGCGCLEPFRGKGGFCLFFIFRFGREKPQLPAGCGGRTQSGMCFPRLGAKPGSPHTCSRSQIHPLKPLASEGASVPQHPIALGCPYKGHLRGPTSVRRVCQG